MSSLLFLFCLTAVLAVVSGYDEANCAVRSKKLYYTELCKVPLGSCSDNETSVPLSLSECDHDSKENNGKDIVYGVLVSLLAAVSFGSMFVPIKKFDTGDGMYFQWMMAIGAWVVGLIINISLKHQPPLFSFSMVSGVLWATGNIFTVPSFSLIGIGIGQTMQGNINMLGGWISGRFILCSPIHNRIVNTVGVVLVIIGTILLSFVKSDGKKKRKTLFSLCFRRNDSEERNPLITSSERMSSSAADINNDNNINHDNDNDISNKESQEVIEEEHQSLLTRLQSKFIGKVIGISLAAFSGLFCAFQFLPIELLRRCQHDAFSCNELDYAFGLFVGILFTSTFWFLVYCVCVKFRPKINPQLTVPALFSGVMLGIANASWLLSNEFVGLPISFPIITAGASTVSCIWGIFVFREITGWKNLGFFLVSFIFVVAGIITVGFSH